MPSTQSFNDDHDLINAFRGGDEFAFVSLYNRYKGSIYAFCVKMLLNKEQAQDIMQDTFLRIYENRERLLHTASFRAWLFTIARNLCMNQLRKERGKVSLERSNSVMPLPARGNRSPISELEKSERIALVNRFLEELKPDYREVLVLREYQNLSYEEISAITCSSLSAVKSRLFKARRKLAAYMKQALGNEVNRLNVRA